jgi:hypothetical protein
LERTFTGAVYKKSHVSQISIAVGQRYWNRSGAVKVYKYMIFLTEGYIQPSLFAWGIQDSELGTPRSKFGGRFARFAIT